MFTGRDYTLENDGDVALVIDKEKVKPGGEKLIGAETIEIKYEINRIYTCK